MDWRRPFGRRRVAAPEIKDSRTGPLIALTGAGRARWTPRELPRLIGGLCTAAIGVLMIALKALIH